MTLALELVDVGAVVDLVLAVAGPSPVTASTISVYAEAPRRPATSTTLASKTGRTVPSASGEGPQPDLLLLGEAGDLEPGPAAA